MTEIDLSKVRAVLVEVTALLNGLDGVELDERAWLNEPHGDERNAKARQSKTLNLVSDRLDYAASLVRVQYWQARGYADPTERAPQVDGHHADGHRTIH